MWHLVSKKGLSNTKGLSCGLNRLEIFGNYLHYFLFNPCCMGLAFGFDFYHVGFTCKVIFVTFLTVIPIFVHINFASKVTYIFFAICHKLKQDVCILGGNSNVACWRGF